MFCSFHNYLLQSLRNANAYTDENLREPIKEFDLISLLAARRMKNNSTNLSFSVMAPDVLQGKTKGIDVARCYCCGLTEECTFSYIARVSERFGGRWICGLCAEAVNEEALRLGVCIEQAVNQHMKFRQQFKSSNPPAKATEDLILALKQVLRRSLDVPGGNQDCRPLSRSKSCFATMTKK